MTSVERIADYGLEISPLGEGTGILIEPVDRDTSLLRLLDYDLLTALSEAGHILARGFMSDIETFNQLVGHHSGKLSLDPAREFEGKVAQKVDSGTGEIGLHLENGATPFLPDLVWFHCLQAAESGSETTVCDGLRVWDELSDDAKSQFKGRSLRFTRTVPSAAWRRFTAYSLGTGMEPDAVDLDDLRSLVTSDGSTTIDSADDDAITYTFDSPAARTPRGGDQLAWANSVFGPSYNYESPVICFATGEPIPEELLDECRRASAVVTEDIAWQDGDTVLIDNTRVMHGRRAITDPARHIVNAQSFVG